MKQIRKQKLEQSQRDQPLTPVHKADVFWENDYPPSPPSGRMTLLQLVTQQDMDVRLWKK
jgi:hypothetical protein